MGLQAIARAQFATIKTSYSEAVVAVVVAGVTCNGVRSSTTKDSQASEYGENGITTGSVYVDASEVSEPERGATIQVGGVDCFVLSVKTDPAGALLSITYSQQRPISGV